MVPKTPADLTLDWLNAHLNDGAFGQQRFINITLTPVGEDVGFLGDLYRVTAEYEPASGPAPNSFIVKFPTTFEGGRASGNSLMAYEREAMYYRHCANRCPSNPPAHYYSEYTGQGEEYLVMIEDLVDARFVEQVKGISQQDAETALEHLAQMHAHYWGRHQDESWLRGFDEWADIYPPQIETGWPLYETNFGYVITPYLKDHFPTGNQLFPEIVRHFHHNRPATMIHGDARMENIAFEPAGTGERVRLYDWQLVSSGPAAYDLVYFLCSSINPDHWQEQGASLINTYYDALVESGVQSYSRADLEEDMQLVACLFFGFASMVGNIVPPDDAGKAVIEATSPRFFQIMSDLEVGAGLERFLGD